MERRHQFDLHLFAMDSEFLLHLVERENDYYKRAHPGSSTRDQAYVAGVRRYRGDRRHYDDATPSNPLNRTYVGPDSAAWDDSQTRNIGLLQQQASNSVADPNVATAYCNEANQVLTQLEAATQVSEIDNIMANHPYGRENNYTDCDPSTAISTAAVAPDSSSAAAAPAPAAPPPPADAVAAAPPAAVAPAVAAPAPANDIEISRPATGGPINLLPPSALVRPTPSLNTTPACNPATHMTVSCTPCEPTAGDFLMGGPTFPDCN